MTNHTPPPPPKRGSTVLVAVASFMLGAVGASVVAYGTSDTEPAQSPTAVTASPTEATTEAHTASPEPDAAPVDGGPDTFAAGEPGTYSENGTSIGTVTVESYTETTEAPDEYTDPPQNGTFLTVTITATAEAGQLFDVNPFDFHARADDGTRYDAGSGNAIFVNSDAALHALTLNGGETVKGTVTFDVPADVTQVVYAPGFRTLGVWELAR